MARPGAIVAAMKAIPGGARYTAAPQSSGMGRISPVQSEMFYNNQHTDTYGPFLDRPSRVFTDGAFAPMSPIQPTPVDQPPPGGTYPGPRYWQYRTAWNLPTPPGTEGLKLASFDQLRTLAQKYSVARAAIELRQEEIRGLRWDVTLTTDAAKAYQGDRKAMQDFGERKAKALKFFRRPDPDFWNFDSFLNAFLEEVFVYDALSLIFRPKFGASFGMGGRGLLGSDLDSLRLVSGPTIRPLIDLHGGKPAAPAPAYQQFLYGVPRSDYMTIATGSDIEDAGLAGSEVNEFNADIMLYAPYWATRETPYGFPPVERALLPIISGLQKQEFQLDYFTEGTVPAVYISPGDTNITPTQIGELQNALNALAGDPAYHLKVVVLPPGSKVEPQRPVDLSDSFDYLVMNQVCMAFDVQPQELGIIPDIGANAQGPSSAGVRFAGQESRDIKSRKSTTPLLKWICDIFNYVIQDICQQPDMQFNFEGLVDDEDKQAITELGVQQVQNAIASIDEIRERLDLPPWGMKETSEPVVFTAQGPVSLETSQQLILMAAQGQTNASGQGTNSGQNARKRPTQPSIRQGGQTKPNGSHPAPVSPHREAPATPQHNAAQGAVQSPGPRTGGTTSRTSVAGSRKKMAASELDSLKRHLRKGRSITTWEPRHITNGILSMIAEDVAKGVLLDTAIERALDIGVMTPVEYSWEEFPDEGNANCFPVEKSEQQFPGWQEDLGLVGRYKEEISQAFQDAEIKGSEIRKDAATGKMYVSNNTLHGMISDVTRETFLHVMNPMWEKAWNLGYDSALDLTGVTPANKSDNHLEAFLATEGMHWLDQVSRTGLGNSSARSEIIARTEVARAMNAGAEQAYRDSGVSYKHLLTAPDDSCDICMTAKEEGDIPLDAIFPGDGPPFHPNCRCVAAPSGFEAEPPMAHIGKSADHPYDLDPGSGAMNCTCGHAPSEHEDESRVCWLLIRAKDESDHWRYLLQQRDDGTWGMPGGKPHLGEDSYAAAYRETTEEVGDIPPVVVNRNFNHIDPDGKQAFLYLVETRMFKPLLNGSTPWETAGTGWFRKKEIGDLNLTPKFREDWEDEVHLEENLPKSLRNRVAETGQQIVLDSSDMDVTENAQGSGSRWPYPHNSQGTEEPENGSGATKPPEYDAEAIADQETARPYPEGNETTYPRRRGRNKPASRFPDMDPGEGGKYPAGGNSDPGPDAISVGAPKNDSGHPVVGVYQPQALKPYSPHSVPPEAFDPAETVEDFSPEADSDVVHTLPGKKKSVESDADLANPNKPGGPADYHDPNPVDAEHVLSVMRSNFPEKALGWVKNSRWIGPVEIPWNRINDEGIETWAASHQQGKVNEFAREIKAGRSGLNPSILIQKPGSDKCDVIDGHHRALAHRKLGQPVLSYVGIVPAGADAKAALETHSSQLHSGSDPGNR
jgi:8-oxo-dGTP pyrophosphatase MutT (NUDIX family)